MLCLHLMEPNSFTALFWPKKLVACNWRNAARDNVAGSRSPGASSKVSQEFLRRFYSFIENRMNRKEVTGVQTFATDDVDEKSVKDSFLWNRFIDW